MHPGRPLTALGLLLLAAVAQAGVITLESRVTVREDPDAVTLEAELSNTGDELADDLRLVLEPPFGPSQTNHLGHLDPGTARSWSARIVHPPEQRQGAFVAVARVAYADASGHPLDSLFFLPYRLGPQSGAAAAAALSLEPPLRHAPTADDPLRMEPAPLETAATLRLSLVPLAGEPLPAALRIVLPDSLALVPPLPALDRLPDATRILEITVTNRSAGAGSRLPAGIVLDLDQNGRRQSLVAETTLAIGGAPSEDADALPAAVLACLLLLWLGLEWRRRRGPRPAPPGAALDIAILALTLWALARQLSAPDWFKDTLTIGGDTPAHHYLVAQLRETLSRGRLVSWAPGWWCGFPLFQYYFPLPYLVILALDVALPCNIAFKLGSLAGVFLLPFAAYAGGRLLRLPRPIPALLAAATLPQLLDTTHTMWGVNLYSTLAGMISNSYSFALFPLALASAVRDAWDRLPRVRTVLLLVLVLLSHFFTSVVLALLLGGIFGVLLLRAARTRDASLHDAALALVPLGLLAFLLMAWWIVPLLATRPWSVDFGEPWQIRLFWNLPRLARWTLAPALALAIPALFVRSLRLPEGWRLATSLCLALMLLALGLFFGGRLLSPVFVNCRLWPFWVYSALTLAALTLGALLCRARAPAWGAAAVLAAILAFPWDPPNYAPLWSRHNFRGLEALREGAVFDEIARRLRGTPGRVASDLHPGNEQLGSSRIFEALPARCGKPILEGGLVNSALGALAAYSVQGEISDQPAGWPLRVKPRAFDPATGLRRIELMGAAQFIARSRKVQQALDEDPAWRLEADLGKWRLYENQATRGELVRAWNTPLPFRRSTDPQRDLVRWFERRANASTPWVLVLPGQDPPPCGADETQRPATPPEETDDPPAPGALAAASRPVTLALQKSGRIRFRAAARGAPHYIAMSYFPNWKVRGAREVYCAAPAGMVVYPDADEVELRFGRTAADHAGVALTLAGLLYLGVWIADGRRAARRLTSGT